MYAINKTVILKIRYKVFTFLKMTLSYKNRVAITKIDTSTKYEVFICLK